MILSLSKKESPHYTLYLWAQNLLSFSLSVVCEVVSSITQVSLILFIAHIEVGFDLITNNVTERDMAMLRIVLNMPFGEEIP